MANGSLYKEADIDRLMAERDAAQERAERMREALVQISTREIENTRRNPDWPRRIARAALQEKSTT